jgi:hypothetical protein
MANEIQIQPPGTWRTILMVSGMVAVLLVFLAVGGLLKKLSDENSRMRTEITQQKQLTSDLVRSSTAWATQKGLESQLSALVSKEDLAALRKDLADLRAGLVAVGNTVGSLGRKISGMEASDRQGAPNPVTQSCQDGRLIDTHGYTKTPQIKEMTDSNSAPVASVAFDASLAKPWSYGVYERRFHLSTAVGKQDDGQMVFYHTLDYSVPEKSDRRYRISLLSSSYSQLVQARRMYWWNPVLDVGVFAGANIHSLSWGAGDSGGRLSVGAELGISFSSHGYTKVDSLWRFFRAGIGYDASRGTAHLSFSPFAFNVGDPLPLVTNLWLYPHVGIDSGGGLLVGGGIGFQL